MQTFTYRNSKEQLQIRDTLLCSVGERHTYIRTRTPATTMIQQTS